MKQTAPLRLGATLLLAAGCLTAPPLSAQLLTLSGALDRSAISAYPTRVAQGQLAASTGAVTAAQHGVQPRLRLEGSYLRTTDPLNAFGFALRQRNLTMASFDPATLNRPDAIGNLATGVVIEVPLFNADANQGAKAARLAVAGATDAVDWSQQSVAYQVTAAYYGAILASERVTTLDSALIAAQAHVHEAESMLRNGVATRSDALLAEVRAGDVEATLLGARADLSLSRAELALAMGTPGDTLWTLPTSLPGTAALRSLLAVAGVAPSDAEIRADIRAAEQQRAAANADVARAQATMLPRLNSFGRLDWNRPATPFGGSSSWTVGVMASWSLQRGGMAAGEVQMAKGRATAAAVGSEALKAQAQLEQQQATAAVQVAAARLTIAERGVVQSSEAHRIVGKKYQGGLATVVELLDAATAETQSRLGLVTARYQLLIAIASQLRANGQPLTPLTKVTP